MMYRQLIIIEQNVILSIFVIYVYFQVFSKIFIVSDLPIDLFNLVVQLLEKYIIFDNNYIFGYEYVWNIELYFYSKLCI